MRCKSKRKMTTFFTAMVFFTISGPVSAQDGIIELKFEHPPVSDSDTSRTLQSLVKVQGTGQFCQDGLYLMTHVGDREDIFEKENQKFIDHPYIDETWRHCSVFSTKTESSVIMGRNWDNQTVGCIIISLYQPPEGYSSISFCRSIDMGFGHKGLEQYTSNRFGTKLLLAPFYAMDGINEHGLTVAIAGLRQTTHQAKEERQLVFVTFLIRKILDQAKDIDKAAELAERFIPFDLDKNSLNGHLLVADASGRSVILEYDQDQWRKIYPDRSWQVLTTKPIYNVSDADLRDQCWRYRSMSETLGETKGDVDWKDAMNILRGVSQKGTTWSVIYSPATKDLYFSVYQDWDKVYHLEGF
jgi:choloylglycine hydrolase